MSVKPVIELTADGSHTLFVSGLNEHYHSVNGAVQESRHVFIKSGLYHCSLDDIYVFEVGFGTGLNAYLTLIESLKLNKIVHYISVEAYPLSDEIIRILNYTEGYSPDIQQMFYAMHKATWNEEVSINENFFLTKIEADFVDFDFSLFQNTFNLIYFDAFAPDKQPAMWTQDIFNSIYDITAKNGILTTYCAKGVVRRMMQQAGYTTERLPGPPGKREMLRAIRKSLF